LSTIGLTSLPVDDTEPVTSSQDDQQPIWLPEVEPTVSNPATNAVQWLQTSVRPGYNGLMESGESVSDNEDDQVLASIQPFTNQRTLINEGGSAAGSKWPDNYQYRPQTQNKSAEHRGSIPSAHVINSASDTSDDDVFVNETQSKKDHFC